MIKKAYFRMALRYHPDKYKEDDGEISKSKRNMIFYQKET